jgi:predicted acyl esterase
VDGSLADEEGESGSRTLMALGTGLGRVQASETDPPSHLTWTGAPLEHDLDVVGDIELQLEAVSTASDTAWIVFLQDVDAAGTVTDITAGYLRASCGRWMRQPAAREFLKFPVALSRLFRSVNRLSTAYPWLQTPDDSK